MQHNVCIALFLLPSFPFTLFSFDLSNDFLPCGVIILFHCVFRSNKRRQGKNNSSLLCVVLCVRMYILAFYYYSIDSSIYFFCLVFQF